MKIEICELPYRYQIDKDIFSIEIYKMGVPYDGIYLEDISHNPETWTYILLYCYDITKTLGIQSARDLYAELIGPKYNIYMPSQVYSHWKLIRALRLLYKKDKRLAESMFVNLINLEESI